jgi:hypothetical protein
MPMPGLTKVSIQGREWQVNGKPLHEGRMWRETPMQGLLMNSRMVQGVFHDLNPQTRPRWRYPDGNWDPQRNTDEFCAAMAVWRAHGLDAFTLNLQGGSPEGYSEAQPWHNSALQSHGAFRADFMPRLTQVLNRADELGMVVILGILYSGQDQRLTDETAVKRAVTETVDFILDGGWKNVVLEIANEADLPLYSHPIIREDRVHELIELAKDFADGRLLTSVSMKGGGIPPARVIAASDFILLHGNGVDGSSKLAEMVRTVEESPEYRGQPIVFNEDDHFDFAADDCHMKAAVRAGAGWGYFDYRMKGEGYDEGYQSMPVNWGISSERKRGFFNLLKEMTGA